MPWTDYTMGEPLRGAVRAAIEEASREALPVNDPLPDELLAAAQIEGIGLSTLQTWIYARKQDGWSAAAFVRWTREIERVKVLIRERRAEART